MDGTRPKKTFGVIKEPSHLCIGPIELAATESRRTLASFIVEFEILLFFNLQFVYFVLKMTWTNGRHSINFHFWVANRVVPALCCCRRACRSRKHFVNVLPSLSNWMFCWFCFQSSFCEISTNQLIFFRYNNLSQHVRPPSCPPSNSARGRIETSLLDC